MLVAVMAVGLGSLKAQSMQGSAAADSGVIFSAPGFEDTMRCNSVPANETPTQITQEERKKLRPRRACRIRRHARNPQEMNPQATLPVSEFSTQEVS